MNIVIFEYRRNLGIEPEHNTLYVDYTTIHKKGLSWTVEEIHDFKPDLIIEREYADGLAVYTDVYKYLPNIPKAYWLIDGHTTLAQHINYAKQFDYIFCAQSWFIPLVESQVKAKVFWLPLCYPNPTSSLNDFNRHIKFDLTFVGNIRPSIHFERGQLVEELLALMGDKFFAGTINDYEQMQKTMASGKATLNVSLNNDLNYRVFEALAFNVPLITDYVTDLDRIDGLADKVIGYDKKDPIKDLAEQIRGAVMVTELGYTPNTITYIKHRHTVTQRLYQLIQMVNTNYQVDYA